MKKQKQHAFNFSAAEIEFLKIKTENAWARATKNVSAVSRL